MFDDVLCLSHLRWGLVCQRPNHLRSQRARGRRVCSVDLVRTADEPRACVATIEAVLAERGTTAAVAHGRARDAMLAQTSWDHAWARMHALVHDTLARRARARQPRRGPPCSTT